MEKDRKDIAGYWVLEEMFSPSGRDMLQELNLQGEAALGTGHRQLQHYEDPWEGIALLQHVSSLLCKNCSSVSCVMFHCCDQTVLLKYLMKYGLSRCLSSKSELVNTSCFPPQVGLLCKYLAEGGCWCDCTTMACVTSPLLPVLWKIRSSLLGLFSDYTGLM